MRSQPASSIARQPRLEHDQPLRYRLGDRWRERLGEIDVPTLIIHGTEDPLFPYGNALALEKEIPDARLLPLERVGHETPPRALWDVVVPAILEHTSAPKADHSPKLTRKVAAMASPTSHKEAEVSLSKYRVSAGFAVSDMERAREFYEVQARSSGEHRHRAIT